MKINSIYSHYQGEIYTVIDCDDTQRFALCESLNHQHRKIHYDDFNSVLGSQEEGQTYFYEFELITELGDLWHKLELALKTQSPITINYSELQISPSGNPLDDGYIACHKLAQLLSKFEFFRECQIDVNPGKYTSQITSPSAWVDWESSVFTGSVTIRALSIKKL